jgi:hypothetical protein
MFTVKAVIPANKQYETLLPLAVPDLKEVKSFANHLHSLGNMGREKFLAGRQNMLPKVTGNSSRT